MIYLVDANIISEVTKPAPQPQVVEWIKLHEPDIAVDPIILGEIQFGIFLLPQGARRRRLERWFLVTVQKIRCLPMQAKTGIIWAKLLADLRAAGKAMQIKDSLIAATALANGLIIATHNTQHFTHAGVKWIDPFMV